MMPGLPPGCLAAPEKGAENGCARGISGRAPAAPMVLGAGELGDPADLLQGTHDDERSNA